MSSFLYPSNHLLAVVLQLQGCGSYPSTHWMIHLGMLPASHSTEHTQKDMLTLILTSADNYESLKPGEKRSPNQANIYSMNISL